MSCAIYKPCLWLVCYVVGKVAENMCEPTLETTDATVLAESSIKIARHQNEVHTAPASVVNDYFSLAETSYLLISLEKIPRSNAASPVAFSGKYFRVADCE